jgi:hypothetical protein
MTSETTPYQSQPEIVSRQEILHHNKFIVSNQHWPNDNIPRWMVGTGIPEKMGELVGGGHVSQLLTDFFQNQEIAFAQSAIGTNIFEINQWSLATNDFIATSPGSIDYVSYSAGTLALRKSTATAIEKLQYLTLVNPFVGKEAINDKYKLIKPLLPLPSMEAISKSLGPLCLELAKQGRLSIIISQNDEYFKPQQVASFFASIPGLPEPIIRDGGHAITTQELHQLFTHQHTAIPPHN